MHCTAIFLEKISFKDPVSFGKIFAHALAPAFLNALIPDSSQKSASHGHWFWWLQRMPLFYEA
jgi:hypothetical protein